MTYFIRILILSIIAVFVWISMAIQTHWYVDTTTIQTTIQWQQVTITTHTETETQCKEVMNTSVQELVTRAQSLFTFQEWETIQEYLLYKGWCGEYPTSTVCSSQAIRTRSETSPYCGDNEINWQFEECDGQTYCSSTCQIITPKADTYAPVYNYPLVIPTGWGDASIYDPYFF